MFLIVGLGNPGLKYKLTRHNIGFLAVDAVAQSYRFSPFKKGYKAEFATGKINGQNCILAKPQTFMNLSGESVMALMKFYKVEVDNLIVVQDDIDQEFDHIKVHHSRGHGGHNGIRNISQLLGHNKYTRIKLGVGRPENPRMNVADFVLQNFNDPEVDQLPPIFESVCDCIESYIDLGYSKTATQFNQRKA